MNEAPNVSPPSVVRWVVFALIATALAGRGSAQDHRTTFFALPDSNGAPGSESMVSGVVAGFGGTLAFDFVEPMNEDRGAYVSIAPDLAILSLKHVTDARLEARDPATGHSFTLTRQPGGIATWTTASPSGTFNPGTPVTLVLDVAIATSNPALAPWLPATSTLTLTGTVTPGFYHQVAYMSGGLAGLPGISITLLLKEDVFVPGIPWEFTSHEPTSTITPLAGGPQAARGGCTLIRDANDYRQYSWLNVAIASVSSGVAWTTPAGTATGSLVLDPSTRGVSGVITGTFNGSPFTRILDGVGDSFEGPMTHPTRIVIDEAGILGSGGIHLDARLTTLRASTTPWRIGQTTTLTLTGRAGELGVIGAAFDPSPGINTPIGDVMVDIDPLLMFSLDPANGIFTGNVAVVGADGQLTATVTLPNDPMLVGYTFFLGGVTLNAGTPTAVTQSLRANIAP